VKWTTCTCWVQMISIPEPLECDCLVVDLWLWAYMF
jgi:hypothetical protein